MPDVITRASTLLEALEEAFWQAAVYNEQVETPPAAILWPDKQREWQPLMSQLRESFPQLLTLGPYDVDANRGPAIWIKCMIAGTLEAADWPEDVVPVIYMPGVSRRDIRAVEQCSEEVKPLAELQFRGVLWTQTNARDWTVRAFLVTENGGLGLEIAQDEATREALRLALPRLAHEPLQKLRGSRIEADTLRELLVQDSALDLLWWIGDPDEKRAEWSDDHWETFCSICRDQYGFDPEKDGALQAAQLLGLKEGPWASVWQRFTEAPKRYPGLEEKLRQARPPQPADLFSREPAWPQENEEAERELRSKLKGLQELSLRDAIAEVKSLEEEHGERRSWVWADMGKAPLAEALEYLVALAKGVAVSLGGGTPDAVATAYREEGWKADDAALTALRSVTRLEDTNVIRGAVDVLYRPWLERGAEVLQEAMATHGVPPVPEAPEASSGEVFLFADALRYDVGQRLVACLKQESLTVTHDWHWAALPSLTPTAKPAVAPLATAVETTSPANEFAPQLDGARLDVRRFRKWMEEAGYQILKEEETGDPEGRAWTEIGTIDSHGHDEGWKIARRIDELLQDVTGRVRQLLNAGWSTIHIVTDHGWLVLPDALPKEDLPQYLTQTRWGRCATLQEEVQADRLVVDWHWNPSVRIAMAPGIHVHRNGLQYAHGGISAQECVVPRLRVTQSDVSQQLPSIESVSWSGLRCRVQVAHAGDDARVDLRTRVQDPATSIALSAKTPKDDGSVSLPVPDPLREGEGAFVVLLRGEEVIATYSTTVGDYE